MNRLIKNELTKIFHKKVIYIILLIALVFIIAGKVINKVLENISTDDLLGEISFYEEQLKGLELSNPQDKELYIMYQTNIEVIKLMGQYEENSWQRNIIENRGYEVIGEVKAAEETENYEIAKLEYEKFIKMLENDDWKSFAKEELEEINTQIDSLKGENSIEIERLKINKQAIEWRLEKDISYAKSNLNYAIEQWQDKEEELIQYKENSKTRNLTYEEKYEKQQTQAEEQLLRYAIENKKDETLNYINDTTILTTSTNADLIDVWFNNSIFIIVAIVVIAGTIVSEEFNKGTIKLLLVRPYNRTKIFFAKLITCFIFMIITFMAISLMQVIVSGIFDGFNEYKNTIAVYNFETSKVETVSLIKYAILTALTKMPMFILLMTLAFTISTIFTNSPIAIAIPILGNMAGEIINQIAYRYEKAQFLRFFVTPNWDLSIFLYGKMPQFEPISMSFSTIICLIYFAIMVMMSLMVFKRKDIKNI